MAAMRITLALVQRQYLMFFLPLALMSALQSTTFQVRNAILARYEDPARELATLGFALSTFLLLWAFNNFIPQMSNVLARSKRALVVTRNTTWALNGLATVFLGLLALTRPGGLLLQVVFDIHGAVLADVQLYLLLLSPTMLTSGHLQWREGLLVQARRTPLLTTTQLTNLLVSSGWLVGAFWLGASPTQAVIGSSYAATLLRVGLTEYLFSRYYQAPAVASHQSLTYRETLRFLLPAAASGAILNFSRPWLFACLGRTSDPLVAVASLRVAYDLLGAMQSISNQFRHLCATFGLDDIAGKRRFMVKVAAILCAALVLSTNVPALSDPIFRQAFGLTGPVLDMTVATARIVSIAPLLLIARNFFHTQLIARSATQGIALGSSARLVVLLVLAPSLLLLDRLNPQSAALILLVGFTTETTIAGWVLRRLGAPHEQATTTSFVTTSHPR